MLRFFDDPLLTLTKALLRISYGLLFFLAAVLLIIAVGVAIVTLTGYQSPFAEAAPADRTSYLLVLMLAPPMLAIFGWFLRVLEQIVATVAAGDPFVPRNAERLNRMAWLMLALKALVLVQDPVINAIFDHSVRSPFHYPNPSLLFPLTLFILARVFRQGTAMREDLEGTV